MIRRRCRGRQSRRASRSWVQKTVAQSFFTLTTVPAARVGPLERLFGIARVVELPLGVVVEDEQAERRLVRVLREVQHRTGIGFSHQSVPSLSWTVVPAR